MSMKLHNSTIANGVAIEIDVGTGLSVMNGSPVEVKFAPHQSRTPYNPSAAAPVIQRKRGQPLGPLSSEKKRSQPLYFQAVLRMQGERLACAIEPEFSLFRIGRPPNSCREDGRFSQPSGSSDW